MWCARGMEAAVETYPLTRQINDIPDALGRTAFMASIGKGDSAVIAALLAHAKV